MRVHRDARSASTGDPAAPAVARGPFLGHVTSEADIDADPVDRLRAQRRLLVTGALDHTSTDRLCAELMLADGLSADPIELIVNSPGGPADVVHAVIDVIGLLRAPLRTR